MTNPHLIAARAEFLRAYAIVRGGLSRLPRHKLLDLQHEAQDATHQAQQTSFSELAAGQMVEAACFELLENPKKIKHQ